MSGNINFVGLPYEMMTTLKFVSFFEINYHHNIVNSKAFLGSFRISDEKLT